MVPSLPASMRGFDTSATDAIVGPAATVMSKVSLTDARCRRSRVTLTDTVPAAPAGVPEKVRVPAVEAQPLSGSALPSASVAV